MRDRRISGLVCRNIWTKSTKYICSICKTTTKITMIKSEPSKHYASNLNHFSNILQIFYKHFKTNLQKLTHICNFRGFVVIFCKLSHFDQSRKNLKTIKCQGGNTKFLPERFHKRSWQVFFNFSLWITSLWMVPDRYRHISSRRRFEAVLSVRMQDHCRSHQPSARHSSLLLAYY